MAVDYSEIDQFVAALQKAASDGMKNDISEWMEACGEEFLKVVEDEIISREVVDTRLLLNSFHKGHSDNIWVTSNGGMSLEVGTNVEYASYVNDGHWTNPKGVARRWVPGYWEGAHFRYDPGAKTGMSLKQKWVPGAHYFDSAVNIFEAMFHKSAEKMLDEWFRKYF